MDILEILEEALAVGPWDKPIVTTVKFGEEGQRFVCIPEFCSLKCITIPKPFHPESQKWVTRLRH